MEKLDTNTDIHKYVAGGIVVYDLVTMKKKWDLHLDLTTDRTKTRAHVYPSPTVVDIDSDGSLEVVIATSMGWIYVIDKHGATKEGFPVLMGEIQGQVIVEDVNNDGDVEICAGDSNSNVVCFDYNGKPIWEKVVSGKVSAAPAVADVDGDGILELIVGTSTGHIWALKGTTGEVLKDFPVKTNGPILSVATIISPNATDSTVIIVPSHDGFVYLVDAKTACVDKIDIGERIYSQVLVDDLTGNGYMNLVVTTMNGNVFTLGTDWPYDPLKTTTDQHGSNAFAYRYNYHGIAATLRSRQFRDEIGRTFRVEFDIIDNRKMPSHIPRRYNVKIAVGGSLTLLDTTYTTPGRYIVTLTTPTKRFYGKVILSMTNEHGARYEDSFTLGFNIAFLNMFKWMVVAPFMSCVVILLYLFGSSDTTAATATKDTLKRPQHIDVPLIATQLGHPSQSLQFQIPFEQQTITGSSFDGYIPPSTTTTTTTIPTL
jgi:hypothetical protein